jgi:hypothetical protein
MHSHTLDPTDGSTVVVDVGGDVGALVLYTGPQLSGTEIDIEPLDRPGRRTHVAVRERRLVTGTTYAAFYPELPAGEYQLHLPDGPQGITVCGGRITELDFS